MKGSKKEHFLFGVLSSIKYCIDNQHEGAARDLREDLLAGYSNEELKQIINKIDPDMELDLNNEFIF